VRVIRPGRAVQFSGHEVARGIRNPQNLLNIIHYEYDAALSLVDGTAPAYGAGLATSGKHAMLNRVLMSSGNLHQT
jgi:hypothetical protein